MKFIFTFLCILAPLFLKAQIQERLYQALPDSIKPADKSHLTFQEIEKILSFGFADDEQLRPELNTLCSTFGPRYTEIPDPKKRLSFIYHVSLYWYNYPANLSDSVVKYNEIFLRQMKENPQDMPLQLGNIYQLNGRMKVYNGQYREGYDDLQLALEVFKSIPKPDRIAEVFSGMNYLFQRLMLYDKVITYTDSSVKYQREFLKGDQLVNKIAYTLSLKSDAYINKYKDSKKEAFADSAYKISTEIIHNKAVKSRWKIISYTLLSQLSYYQKQFENSIAFADSSFTLSKGSVGETLLEIRTAYKGLSLLELGRTSEAEEILKNFNPNPNDNFAGTFFEHLYQYEKRRGNTKKALMYHEQLMAHYQEAQRAVYQGDIFEMEQKYNVAARDLEIVKLKEKEKRNRLGAAGIGLVVLFIALVAAIRYRNNQVKTKLLIGQINDLTETQILRMKEAEELAKEQERRRLGQELHDDLSASIAATVRHLQMKSEDEINPDERLRMSQISTILEESYYKVRGRAHKIYLEETNDSFWERLTDYAYVFFAGTSMKVTVDLAVSGVLLNIETKTTLLVVIKEAITNIIKHARASKVEILVYNELETIVMEINDNGQGISENKISKNMGLKSLQNRISKLNGEMTISRRKSGGTSLEISVPVTPVLI